MTVPQNGARVLTDAAADAVGCDLQRLCCGSANQQHAASSCNIAISAQNHLLTISRRSLLKLVITRASLSFQAKGVLVPMGLATLLLIAINVRASGLR